MISLKINNNILEVEEGTSVMKAAQILGVEIPNMCWHDELEHFTSCMLCLVKDEKSGRLFPSCSVQVAEGMCVVTDDDEIYESRQTALELLLSEHVGDCEAPCQIGCPAHMNIPLMNRLIATGRLQESLAVVKQHIALPAVLGYICPAPCEGACHRRNVDQAVSICLLKRIAGEEYASTAVPRKTMNGKNVAIIGAGPAGLAAAYYLQLEGVQVTLLDKNMKAGGQLRSAIDDEKLPKDVLDKEINLILETGVLFKGEVTVSSEDFISMQREYDALIVATGSVTDDSFVFGLERSAKGIEADRNTYQTSISKVFAIGNALRSSKLAVRSVGQGREAARSVIQYLKGQKPVGEPAVFNSRFGRLVKDEYQEYLKESVDSKRVYPKKVGSAGYSLQEAIAEAKRCMHCDCRAINDCKLRDYSDSYGANQQRFKTSDRRTMSKQVNHDLIIYEPQKCIKCGICVRLTEKYGERYGFTYIGRGFDIKINIPFSKGLQDGLTLIAEKVAKGCPTGAISLRENKDK